jgi:ABC-type multidrug transport system fused ATPase/permease subunit
LKKKDSRLNYFKNVLNNIEFVKMRALENFYSMKIFDKREEEIKRLNVLNIANSLMLSLNFISYCMGVSAFLWFLAFKIDRVITYEHFGEIFALFNPSLGSCSSMAITSVDLITRWVSLKRLERFLNLNTAVRNYLIDDPYMNEKSLQYSKMSQEEKDKVMNSGLQTVPGKILALRCRNANFNWHEYLHPEFKLNKIQ